MDTKTNLSNWAAGFPRISNIGLTGLLVSFSDALSEVANRAALAFRAQIEAESWAGVEETTTSLTSVYIGFDSQHTRHATLEKQLLALLESCDWRASELPQGRKLWRIPTVFGGEHGPQLAEAAALAQMSPQAAIEQISTRRVRVLTIGYAPGQPYLGTLPEPWNIPRQSGLTAKVPCGALVVAIRQLVLFTADSPTGWRHIGQTGFRGFRPESDTPFPLRPGDEVVFEAIEAEKYAALAARDESGDFGATWERLQ